MVKLERSISTITAIIVVCSIALINAFDYISTAGNQFSIKEARYKFIVKNGQALKRNFAEARSIVKRRDLNLLEKMKLSESLSSEQNQEEGEEFAPENNRSFILIDKMTGADLTKASHAANSSMIMSIDNSTDLCLYSNINTRVNQCFQKHTNCNVILDCVTSMNLVEVCNLHRMLTPTIWVLSVYEILKNLRFCSTTTSQCDTHENQYLIKLDELMRTLYAYGPAFLDQPKIDTKQYCSKSNNLVAEVKDLFDIYDYCFDPQSMNEIKNSIDDISDQILDRDCRYCISPNLYFEDCIYGERFYHFNNFLCKDSLKCMQNKIEWFRCDQEPDQTPLKILASLISNVTFICDYEESDKNNTSEVVKEWLMSIDSCIKENHYIGLEANDAPLHVDYCHEVDEAFQCVRNHIKALLKVKPEFKSRFARFYHEYELFKFSCAKKAKQNSSASSVSSLVSSLLTELDLNRVEENEEAKSGSFFHNSSSNHHKMVEDDKKYYDGKIVNNFRHNWIDIDSFDYLKHGPIKDNEFARNYLKATIVKLKFRFPFYGHLLDKVIIATGGFLYVGSLLNPLITKAQYIAPLMANFDPNLNLNRSSIIYVDNSTHFICTWERLLLKDQLENGEYTFQVILNKDGQIIFNYKQVPSTLIVNVNHEVKIGLSDAYTFYKLVSFSKIEYTIVQYNVVNILLENLSSGTTIFFNMLPNCIQLKSCDSCLQGVGSFKCLWCPVLARCSDTLDRYRQEWMEHSCPTELNTQTNAVCMSRNMTFSFDKRVDSNEESKHYIRNIIVGIIVTIFLSMFLTTIGWTFYAYKNPNSPSGLWLIDHRPAKLVEIVSNHLVELKQKKASNDVHRLEEENVA